MVSSLIVKPRAAAGASIASALRAFDASSLSKSANVPLTVLRRMSGEAHVITLKQPVTLSEARVIAARLMHNDPSLEYAEPDRMVYPLTTTPTDPGYGNQWHYFAIFAAVISIGSGLSQNTHTSSVRPVWLGAGTILLPPRRIVACYFRADAREFLRRCPLCAALDALISAKKRNSAWHKAIPPPKISFSTNVF
jgi:hypothetical protein